MSSTTCIPFLRVRYIEQTIAWYERLGFVCRATNRIWERDCELNWARIEWDGAGFMIGIDERSTILENKDSSLWFNTTSLDAIREKLASNQIEFETEPETFYGRSVISFKDLNGFGVSFSCPL